MGLLGEVIALKVGLTYEECHRKEILGPVGMKDTGVNWDSDELTRAAQGYDGYGRSNPQDQWQQTFAGGGGLHSTVNDMLKFARAVMDPDSSIAGIFSDPAGDSLGIKQGVKHGGQTIGGFTSFFTVNRVDQTAMVVWFNSGFPEAPIYNNLFMLMHGVKPYPVILPHFVRLPEEDLKQFEGLYLAEGPIPNGKSPDVLKLFVKNGHLFAGSDSLEFYPEAGGNFFEKLQHTDVIFHHGNQGKITGFSAFWKNFKKQ
jgi:CubicO group peptidase (beta-lactamase class C family)